MIMSETGIVYILTNPAMPGLVKIGKTFRGSTEVRMAELYSSGVPVPFDCFYAAKVKDAEAVENALHNAFAPYRTNPKREFFGIEPDQAAAILRLLGLEDATPQIEKESEQIDEESREAAKRLKQRRPSLNFSDMGIAIGSVLEAIETEEKAVVETERTVRFRDEIISLTRATQMALEIDYQVAPTPHWTYNGRILQDIYNETYRPQE
jgi:hypothetical protein